MHRVVLGFGAGSASRGGEGDTWNSSTLWRLLVKASRVATRVTAIIPATVIESSSGREQRRFFV
ncbi:MAG: hypothetical protein HYY13_08440 [Nitrospirae bacterium]|nr:hypothetical protein [Nitrospirota bacterium]